MPGRLTAAPVQAGGRPGPGLVGGRARTCRRLDARREHVLARHGVTFQQQIALRAAVTTEAPQTRLPQGRSGRLERRGGEHRAVNTYWPSLPGPLDGRSGPARYGIRCAPSAPTRAAYFASHFPLSAAAGAEIFADYEQHFAEGLELVIDGIAARYGID
ncbi:TetR/AcrR family transcriptional regulator C-terminal domain-containing protein [Streptomyces sp. NPDC014889]|uniref:TetR/AcrR family transcriptional regulator C-terminal domain-containing protein n=1 Tax=Streptomyces sp. NPDC014889 TaxID=3364928 RepID=UPI0036FC8257